MNPLNDLQLTFWRALLAPFPDHELSTVKKGGGKELTYVDSRALMNRLDSICGPHGWDVSYRPTDRGYTARMGISVPLPNGEWAWLYKEDGGGFEDMGMKNREGEWETDLDNDEKSAYTNALRRVAQNAWGIGRYIYRKGIPTWLDPNAQDPGTLPPAATRPVAETPRQAPPARERSTRDHTPAPEPEPAPTAPAPAKQFDNFKIPRAGKGVYAWCKEMEKYYEAKLMNGMQTAGEEKGWGTTFADWTQEQVNVIAMGCIEYIATLPNYKGQFDKLLGDAPAAAPKTAPTTTPTAGVNIADLRRDLMTKMQAFCHLQTGSAATPPQLKEAFAKIAPHAKTGEGKLGEVAESLGKLTDVVWIRNMIAMVDDQIAQATAPGNEEDGEIPF